MPYKAKGNTVYVRKGGRWRKKKTYKGKTGKRRARAYAYKLKLVTGH